MDWLRRNWPDLAIGVALVGVIAGIVATLVTGGSFFPVGPTAQPPAAVAPATPGGAAEPTVPADDLVDPLADVPPPVGAVSVLTPDGAVPADAPAVDAPDEGAAPAADAPAEGDAPAASGLAAPAATPPAATPAAPPADDAPAPTPAPAAASAATPATPAPAAAGPLPTAASDAEAPYRVSVGAFGNVDNAERLATTFRDAGYPVFTGAQGALTIVLVGPYASEGDAQQVAARIAAGGFGIDPVVYRFRPDAPTPGASTPAPGAEAPAAAAPAPAPAPGAATPAAATPAAPATPAPIATASSGRSLQVGAFADAASARPLQERLATVGLRAFEVREDGLTKLLVGPFDAEGLAAARARLAELGIESFPR